MREKHRTQLDDLHQRLTDSDLTSEHAYRVALFMSRAGQHLPSKPTIPNANIRELRVRLLLEEVLEFAKASGIEVRLEGEATTSVPLDFHHLRFSALGNDAVDLEEVADGLADVSVVNAGAMLAYGIADVPLLKEVDRSNLEKFKPGGYKHPQTGKWIKPPDHQPPKVADVLRAQGWRFPSEGGNESEEDQVPLQGDGHEQAG